MRALYQIAPQVSALRTQKVANYSSLCAFKNERNCIATVAAGFATTLQSNDTGNSYLRVRTVFFWQMRILGSLHVVPNTTLIRRFEMTQNRLVPVHGSVVLLKSQTAIIWRFTIARHFPLCKRNFCGFVLITCFRSQASDRSVGRDFRLHHVSSPTWNSIHPLVISVISLRDTTRTITNCYQQQRAYYLCLHYIHNAITRRSAIAEKAPRIRVRVQVGVVGHD